uniref:Uncharacterized protein n=1 Tax=Arundo donax TaxID=35708 RepID=A0A0A9EF47_ARUDO
MSWWTCTRSGSGTPITRCSSSRGPTTAETVFLLLYIRVTSMF